MPDRPAKKTASRAATTVPSTSPPHNHVGGVTCTPDCPAYNDTPAHQANRAKTAPDTDLPAGPDYADLQPEDTGLRSRPEPVGVRRAARDAQLAAAGLPPIPEDPGTIEDALVILQDQMPPVRRTQTARIPGKNGGQGYSYNYADLGDVTAALRPLMTRLRLVFVCTPRRTEAGQYELLGSLRHAPSGETVEGALPLYGRASQELGSSITYARRYLLGCLTGLVTDDDDDSHAAAHAGPTYEEPQVTTEELLGRLDQAAETQGITRDQITAKWREKHGGVNVDVLPTLAPFTLLPLVESIEAYITGQAAMAPAN